MTTSALGSPFPEAPELGHHELAVGVELEDPVRLGEIEATANRRPMTAVPLGALDVQPRILGCAAREYGWRRIRRRVVDDDHDGRRMLCHDIAAELLDQGRNRGRLVVNRHDDGERLGGVGSVLHRRAAETIAARGRRDATLDRVTR